MAAIGVGPNQPNLNRDFLISKPNDGLRGPNLVPNLTPAQKRALARRDEIVATLKAQGGRRQQRDADLEELQAREEARMAQEAAEKAAREEAERTAREITDEDRELLNAALDELASGYETWEELSILHQAVGYLTPLQLQEYYRATRPNRTPEPDSDEYPRYQAHYKLKQYTSARENEASSDPTIDVSAAVLTLEDALEVLSTRNSCPSMNAWGWRTGTNSLDVSLRQTFEYLGLDSTPTKLDEEVLKRAVLQLWPDLVELPKYAVMEHTLPSEFGEWLKDHAHRVGAVGALARFTRECYSWPRGKGQLKSLEAELSWRAPEHLQGLREAWPEYELYRTLHAT